jgi:hypothetical protein
VSYAKVREEKVALVRQGACIFNRYSSIRRPASARFTRNIENPIQPLPKMTHNLPKRAVSPAPPD